METSAMERENKIYASLSTLLMFLMLMFIVFFIKFYTPIPPFPESGDGEVGLEVNFGNTDMGMGANFSHDIAADKVKNDQKLKSPEDNSNDKNVITDQNPDNTYVKTDKKDNPKKNNDKNPVKDQQPDKDAQNAFKNFSDKSSSDGDKDKAGNQGKPEGGDSKNYDGNSKTGDGEPGIRGPNYKVSGLSKGRRIYYPPQKISDFTEEGVIVVDIIVDKDGKVTFAEVNRAKSINPNYVLCAKARQSAMTTKFNKSPDGTMEEKGSITFKFSLK